MTEQTIESERNFEKCFPEHSYGTKGNVSDRKVYELQLNNEKTILAILGSQESHVVRSPPAWRTLCGKIVNEDIIRGYRDTGSLCFELNSNEEHYF